MITKERLEELIKKGATIWVANKYSYSYSVDLNKLNFIGIADNKDSLFTLDYLIEDDPETVLIDYLEYLFETKEDAEEYAEFGNITRTERLPYMNWEEFLKSNTGINFYRNGYEYGLHKVRYSDDDVNPDWRVEVYVLYYDLEESSDELFSKPLTRENYNEARRLCMKLFRGEEL